MPLFEGDRPVALITGAARRVGRAVAIELARQGCDVVITYLTSPGHAEVTAEQVVIDAPRATARIRRLDLADLAATEAFARELAAELPRLDVLVHNASEYAPTPTASVDVATLERVHRVNTLAPLLLSRALAPLLARSPLPGGGSIVSMGDLHAMGPTGQPRKDFIAYSMSKAALLEMTLVLARELAPRVRCNAVAPGVVAFPEEGREADPDVQTKYLSRVPLARSGTPADAAAAVAFLALHARYTTGHVLPVDGGRSIT